MSQNFEESLRIFSRGAGSISGEFLGGLVLSLQVCRHELSKLSSPNVIDQIVV